MLRVWFNAEIFYDFFFNSKIHHFVSESFQYQVVAINYLANIIIVDFDIGNLCLLFPYS